MSVRGGRRKVVKRMWTPTEAGNSNVEEQSQSLLAMADINPTHEIAGADDIPMDTMEPKRPQAETVEADDVEEGLNKPTVWVDENSQNAGVARIEAMKVVQGKNGRWALWIGIIVMLIY